MQSQNKIKLGNYTYSTKPNDFFFKDYKGLNVKSSDLYLGRKRVTNCLNTMSRNDSVFSKGVLKFDNKTKLLYCTELNYFDITVDTDSIIRISKQNKDGSFKFIKYRRFKNGQIIDEYPKNKKK